MRALVCHGYGEGENLALAVMAKPEPGKGEIRVQVLACGANASDWEFVTGRPAYARLVRLLHRAKVFGSDVVGIVDKLGEGVTGLKTGQRVMADTFEVFGGFATFCVAPAKLWVPVPDRVSDILAAALPQSGAIALSALEGRLRVGMRVLVNGGGGGSGPLTIQLAKGAGAEVWAVDTAAKADVMHEAGADRVLDFATTDYTKLDERFDLILDLWGNRRAGRVRRVLAPGGQYLWIGGPVAVLLSMLLASVWTRATDRRVGILMVKQGPQHLPHLLDLLQAGEIHPVVGEVTSLECAREALQLMGARQVAGKLVIVP